MFDDLLLWFEHFSPIAQSLLAGGFTWFVTALAFAAGAMIYVVVEEPIPESQRHDNTDLATLGVMGRFPVMMILDVALG